MKRSNVLAADDETIRPDDDEDEKTDSEDDNNIEDETISGENDVEYAEFSMSLFIPPKDQLNKSRSEAIASKRTQKQNNSTNSDNSNGICDTATSTIDDDFMILSLNGVHNGSNNNNSVTSPISCKLKQNYDKIITFTSIKFSSFIANRSRYRTPVTSASVLETLLEPTVISVPKIDNGLIGSSSASSSTESLKLTTSDGKLNMS